MGISSEQMGHFLVTARFDFLWVGIGVGVDVDGGMNWVEMSVEAMGVLLDEDADAEADAAGVLLLDGSSASLSLSMYVLSFPLQRSNVHTMGNKSTQHNNNICIRQGRISSSKGFRERNALCGLGKWHGGVASAGRMVVLAVGGAARMCRTVSTMDSTTSKWMRSAGSG